MAGARGAVPGGEVAAMTDDDRTVDAQAKRITELLHEVEQLRARYVEQCRIIEAKRADISRLRARLAEVNELRRGGAGVPR